MADEDGRAEARSVAGVSLAVTSAAASGEAEPATRLGSLEETSPQAAPNSQAEPATRPGRLDRTTSFSARSAMPAGEDTVAGGSPAPPAPDEVPRRIGRFAVLRRIGSGGMGSVYAAYDEELARRVALKVLHHGPDLPPEGRAAIVAEARAMARLSHANVVQVYEIGEHAGELFLVMEYVEGRTLTTWLKEQEHPWPEIVRLFSAAGQGLAAAHRVGLVHRDFKPDNVLVDREGIPRVADFGLARPEGAMSAAGTPMFMSPEQLLGAPTDARSDQFNFCAALHVALYGTGPFVGENLAALTESVTRGELRPRPAGTRVPAALHAVLVRGLASDAGRRFPTTEALLAALRLHLPETTRRRPVWLALPLVAAVAVAVWIGARGGPPGPSLAELTAIGAWIVEARDAAARAEWIYPGEAGKPTAIRTILALEHMPTPADAYARARAEALRQIFAEDLAALAERYWGDEATRSVARDFYAQALVFWPDHALALERSRLTPGQVAELRARAEETSFSPAQLEAAAPLRVLAVTHDPELVRSLARIRDACPGSVLADMSSPDPASPPSSPPDHSSKSQGSKFDLREEVEKARRRVKHLRQGN